MANKKLGYIKLYRSLKEHWIWQINEPFDARSAWIDILMTVNHEEKKIVVGRSVITLRPGQTWTSIQKLAKNWGWSYNKAKRFIKMLKSDGMIYIDSTANGSCLTVINWDNFANQQLTNESADERTDERTHERTGERTGEQQTRMIKNDKNDKELKEEGRILPPPSGGGIWQ
jgi:DNA replication protein DnaD